MDRYPTFDQIGTPAEDGRKSATAMAERDLEATLQLLAERARYLTGASGVSIGLRSGSLVVCQAGSGPLALQPGSQFSVDTGLAGESLHLRQILRCDDVGKGRNRSEESWQELGVRSVMVGPLLRDGEAVGVFELLAKRADAFEERDVAMLQRLSEMVLTALGHFDAASPALAKASSSKLETPPVSQTRTAEQVPAVETPAISAVPATASPEFLIVPVLDSDPPELEQSSVFKVQRCQACGFPVSESRTLCLDCEEAQSSEGTASLPRQLFIAGQPGWLQSHLYTMGTLVLAALTVALLVLKLK